MYISRLITCFVVLILYSCHRTTEKARPSTRNDTTKEVVMSENKEIAQSRPGRDVVHVDIEKITKVQFDSAGRYAQPDQTMEKITDVQAVQKQLAGIVDFITEDGYLGIKRINFRNGASSADKEEFEEYGFVAYFPEEDILLCEGGHSTDVSFNLSTGQETYEVGNPDLITTSPNGRYRLNKVYEGQECFYHFIQKREQDRYYKVLELGEIFEKKTGKWLCVTGKEFWTDDVTLYMGLVTQYKEEGNDYDFYRIKIND